MTRPANPCFTGVDERGRRVVLEILSGRWSGPEIITRLQDVHRRFGSIITVESVAAQRFLLQFAAGAGLAVRPFTTSSVNKHDELFGVESLAVEMRAAQWVIPSGRSGADLHPEVQQWISEMLFYDPSGHTGDRLMASWFARETARECLAGRLRHLPTVDR